MPITSAAQPAVLNNLLSCSYFYFRSIRQPNALNPAEDAGLPEGCPASNYRGLPGNPGVLPVRANAWLVLIGRRVVSLAPALIREWFALIHFAVLWLQHFSAGLVTVDPVREFKVMIAAARFTGHFNVLGVLQIDPAILAAAYQQHLVRTWRAGHLDADWRGCGVDQLF